MQKLGDYIREVDVRNKDLKVTNLMGIKIDKHFMPSVANTIGTDLSNYKVVSKNQFACNLMHVGRDEKIPIAILLDENKIIVSPAYFTFEIINSELLLPEYLMMWFSRKEFDRNAWFYTDADVRGGMDKRTLMDMQLPIPSIEQQREIVSEYETISKRIKLNEQIIKNLEATAQTLYHKMFVEGIDKENLPEGWRIGTLGEIVECLDNKRKPLASYERINMEKKYPYYGAASLMDYVNDYIFDGTYILMGEDGTVINEDNTPIIQYVCGKFWVNNHAHVLRGINGFDENILYIVLKQTKVNEYITGGVQAKINKDNMMSIPILIPTIKELTNLKISLMPIFRYLQINNQYNIKLTELQSLLLAKMGQ
ncbi:MAG: restriction endonuclease subunit S [Bacteroidales bacterium]|nr:restriction endonuclease subunit S [Bacteroidales bacterium]